jgi:hypothetical protein
MAPSPEQASQAGPGDGVIGWKLNGEQRQQLLERFPPRFSEVDADHVTLQAKVAADAPLPDRVTAAIVGRGEDGEGVEAMVVAIDGTTDRPDGSTYHITWSLAPGRQARESNQVLADRGWQRWRDPVALTLTPARLR